MPAVNGVGEPCAGERHARFEAAGVGNGVRNLATDTGVAQPSGKPTEERPQALPQEKPPRQLPTLQRAAHPRPIRQGGGGSRTGFVRRLTTTQPVGMRGVASRTDVVQWSLGRHQDVTRRLGGCIDLRWDGCRRWTPGIGSLRDTYGAYRTALLCGIDTVEGSITAYHACAAHLAPCPPRVSFSSLATIRLCRRSCGSALIRCCGSSARVRAG